MSLRDELLQRFPALRSLPNAVIIGGAVRDLLLGRMPADVDVECDDPASVASSLGHVIPLGRGELAVYRVVVGSTIYDFSARTDLARRDFTINAMAMDLATGEITDRFEGRRDLERKVVRMIRAENFEDDPLRMLRAIRLALQFGFVIDSETIAAIRAGAARILTVAAERVTYELHAIFSAGRLGTALQLLRETALDEPLFGYTVDPARFHDLDLSCAASYALVVRDVQEFGARWKWSHQFIRRVGTMQRLLREPDIVAIHDAGGEVGSELPALFRAAGKTMPPLPDFAVRSLLGGEEIAAISGIAPGPRLGALKRALLEAQLRGELSTRDEAEAFIRTRAP